jgi:ATP-dependent helicase/nuclease subunit B
VNAPLQASETRYSGRKRLFTIPPGAPFLPTFAKALMAGEIVPGFPDTTDPLSLSAATIYVPTRRAARGLASELARLVPQASVFLPRILPLGGFEEIETGQLFAPTDDGFEPDLPEAIGELDRRLVLAQLVQRWSAAISHAIVHFDKASGPAMHADEPFLVASTPVHAFALAQELAGLIDEFVIEGIAFEKLGALAPDNLDRYWNITLEFLKIAFQMWPQWLQENGRDDRVHRQALLIERRIAGLDAIAARGPQIVLGSTGTNKATAQLINAIAGLANGAVVLPGLDLSLDARAWENVGVAAAEGHPQSALKHLLERLDADRADVVALGSAHALLDARARFISEALRPAQTTDAWRDWRAEAGDAQLSHMLTGTALIEAADEGEEARAIAAGMRRLLEMPGRTAALVTPDRSIAQRVRAELARWNIEVDDSGGDPLASMPHGVLARLLLACAAPVPLSTDWISLLAHPLTRLSLPAGDLRRVADDAEIGVLRGQAFDIGKVDEILHAARTAALDYHAHRAIKAIGDERWMQVETLLQRLRETVAPLHAIAGKARIGEWAMAHRRSFELLRMEADAAPFIGDDGETLLQLFEDMVAALPVELDFTLDEYAALFDRLAREAIVRGPRQAHPRLKILGLLEARLISADTMFIAGLDEAVWPPQARTDAFLNRPMREQLGLTAPERRIGQTAHDFEMAIGAPEVFLSRAAKRGGSPVIASRFLQRMEALAGASAWAQCQARGEELVHLARVLDEPPLKPEPVEQPKPCPPIELRPKRLSVTRIETMRRDPYSIYAEFILELKPLDEADEDDGPRQTGTLTHRVLSQFQKEFPDPLLPPHAADRIIDVARQEFAELMQDPGFMGFRWPRIEAALLAYIEWDAGGRSSIVRLLVEEKGKLPITLADGTQFVLSAEADRIEEIEGGYRIVDFKTGQLPTHPTIAAGFSVQVTLEAAMLEKGGFAAPQGAKALDALYVKIGSSNAGQEVRAGKGRDDKTLESLIAEHYTGLVDMLEEFNRLETPYLSRPYPQFINRFGAYDHLARVNEWSLGAEGEEE